MKSICWNAWPKTRASFPNFFTCILGCLMLLQVSSVPARATIAFPLHTSGAYIVDANGSRVRLNAANWYGAESKDFVVGGLQAQSLQGIVQTMKGMGINAVRLPWSNEMYETNPVVPSYALTANPSLQGQHALTVLDDVIHALSSAGIMVILDNHNSDAEWCCGDRDGNTLWYNSTYPESSWLADWEGMATRYKSNTWVIGADLRNEPRFNATWGGSQTTDWHAAATRGGNAVLGANPSLLIFVEGVNYALDLSGASTNPIQLNASNQLVYEAHDYGYDYSSLASYADYVGNIGTRWGFLVSGSNPQPLWIGEFGTCNSASTCVSSNSSSDNGNWFGFLTTYIQQYQLDWGYWAINGTQTTGSGRTYGAAEGYGMLNTSWNGSSLSALTSRLSMMSTATPGFQFSAASSIPISSAGQSGSTTVSVIPLNGYTGAVSLSCAVSSTTTTSGFLPTCTIPSSASISGASLVNVAVKVATSSNGAQNRYPRMAWNRAAGISIAGLLLFCVPVARAKRLAPLLSLILVAMLGVAMLGLTGCSGASGNSSGNGGGTSAGTYVLTVTGAASGVTTQTAQINIVVN